MIVWNNDWKFELQVRNYDAYIRLCECRNTRKDVILMSALTAKYNPKMSVEDCFDHIIAWVGYWNNQFELTDYTDKEYNYALKQINNKIKALK